MNLKDIKTFEQLKLAKHKFHQENQQLKSMKLLLKTAPITEKAKIGKKIQQMIAEAEILFNQKMIELKQQAINEKINDQWVDINEPLVSRCALHPLTIISNRFRTWLNQNGYYEISGNDIEEDKYNFERLNIGKNHPVRDVQASLFIDDEKLLRTHNTGYSARELEKNVNQSFSQFAIGNVYRNDQDDSTHSHQFMQLDLVSIGNVSVANLIWTIKELLSYVLEKEVKIRLRPSFFPFTKPSIEVDIWHQNRWIEVLGSGMLDDKVLKAANYNNGMNGFAAGIGIDRVAMIKYNISDIRQLYKNDLRFLQQFKGVK